MVERRIETPETKIRALPIPLNYAPLAEEFMRDICNFVYVGASPTRCPL